MTKWPAEIIGHLLRDTNMHVRLEGDVVCLTIRKEMEGEISRLFWAEKLGGGGNPFVAR